jgi:uncharacterized protein
MKPTLPHYNLLAKPAGAACNLGCHYCFFLSKENLYPARESPLMTDQLLETYIRQLMQSSPGPQVDIAWQGREPMLRDLGFYRRSVELAEKYRQPHQRVQHTIQTNGTLIDDEWAAFFKQNAATIMWSLGTFWEMSGGHHSRILSHPRSSGALGRQSTTRCRTTA